MRIRPHYDRPLDPNSDIAELLGIRRYPIVSWVSRTEVGTIGSDDWTCLFYDMFLFRRVIGIRIDR